MQANNTLVIIQNRQTVGIMLFSM